MKTGLEFSRKVDTAYMALCKPLRKKWHLTQTALDILMFLANNPDFRTARDIVEIRKLKALIVFFPVLMKKHVRNLCRF